ncbi:MAG: GGDEF domain-containing response regulator [Gallionellaceae bacterium]|nr:GGDEF domain-containing response regulator [Gallionellaceae bacterium]
MGSMTGRKLRVLAIEDSEDDFELVRNELSENGFIVEHERVEAPDALKSALKNGKWDVVICDHNLPAMDSTSALHIVRDSLVNVPFIIVSGLIPDEMVIEAMRQGAKDFIRKDNLSRLAPAIERELQQATMQSEYEQVLENFFKVSHFDSLTGLPNCEYLYAYLKAMTSNEEFGHPFAVFLVDIKRFRQITKTLGVPGGDKVLVETANRLRKVVGSGTFVARHSADRFAIVVSHLEHEIQAKEVVVEICQCMDEVFVVDGHELFVKVSVGASFYPKDSQQWEELLKNAESALYLAKSEGGNSFQVFDPKIAVSGKDQLVFESALYHALDENQFVLHYQPQLDLHSGQVVGAEALIRWEHPELGMIPPVKFIPLLEETGLIVPVGEWVLRTACAQNRQWQDAGLAPIRVAVNLSAIQFRQPGLADTVKDILAETRLNPGYLELEITENIALEAEDRVIVILEKLRAVGVQIAIDDFGTGYSSLSYLKRFPINRLKIDRSFLKDFHENDNSIVTAIIGMGRSLKLKVIAEGVETSAQADFLKLLGCDEVQGYFYGKPMEADCMALLMERSAGAPQKDMFSCT